MGGAAISFFVQDFYPDFFPHLTELEKSDRDDGTDLCVELSNMGKIEGVVHP